MGRGRSENEEKDESEWGQSEWEKWRREWDKELDMEPECERMR